MSSAFVARLLMHSPAVAAGELSEVRANESVAAVGLQSQLTRLPPRAASSAERVRVRACSMHHQSAISTLTVLLEYGMELLLQW